MRLSRFVAWAACVALLSVSTVTWVSGQEPPPMPKPGPEHQVLKMDEGVWDATVEINPGPGASR